MTRRARTEVAFALAFGAILAIANGGQIAQRAGATSYAAIASALGMQPATGIAQSQAWQPTTLLASESAKQEKKGSVIVAIARAIRITLVTIAQVMAAPSQS